MREIFFEITYLIDDFLSWPPLDNFLTWFKPTIGIFCLILLINIIFLIKKVDYFWFVNYRLDSLSGEAFIKKADKKWATIERKLLFGDEPNLKMAVIEADNFLDELLKRMGLPGKDMGERLRSLDVSKLKSLNLVWEAHKLRNRIVHEAGYRLTTDEAERALKNYRQALEDLQVL